MATHEERLALLTAAQKKAGFEDKGAAERYLMYWEALLPTIPAAAVRNSSMMLVEIIPTTDEQAEKAAEIQELSEAYIKGAVCPTS